MSFVGGGQVAVALGMQSARDTPNETTPKLMRFLRFMESSRRLLYEGDAEVGGGIYTAVRQAVLASRPAWAGEFVPRLGSLGYLLESVGFDRTTAGSPAIHTYATVPLASNWNWLSTDVLYDSGFQIRHVGSRVASLDMNFPAGGVPMGQVQAFSLRTEDSDTTQNAEVGAFIPTPSADILDANLTFLGDDDFELQGFGFRIDVNYAVRRMAKLGSMFLIDLVPTRQIITTRFQMLITEDRYKQFQWGAAAATAPGPLIANGAVNIRINTGENLAGSSPYNIPGYIEFDCSSMNAYAVPDSDIESDPDDVVAIDVVGRCVVAPTIKLLNGQAGTIYTPA